MDQRIENEERHGWMERKWLKVKMILLCNMKWNEKGAVSGKNVRCGWRGRQQNEEKTLIKNCGPLNMQIFALTMFRFFAIFLVNWVKEMANNNWYEMWRRESKLVAGRAGGWVVWWLRSRVRQNEQRKQIMRSKIDECNLWRSATEQNITKESRMIYAFFFSPCIKFSTSRTQKSRSFYCCRCVARFFSWFLLPKRDTARDR